MDGRKLDGLTEFVAALGLRGVWLDVSDDGERLLVHGPTDALSTDVRERLTEAKPALLHALAPSTRSPIPGEPACPSCGGPAGAGLTRRCPGCVARSWRAVLRRQPGRTVPLASRTDTSSSEGGSNEPTTERADGALPLFADAPLDA